jgi:hypothetical protein
MDPKVTGAVELVEEVVAGIDELEVRVQGEGTTPEGKVSRLGLNLNQALVEKGSRCWSNIALLGRLLCGNSRISVFPYLTYQHGARMNPSLMSTISSDPQVIKLVILLYKTSLSPLKPRPSNSESILTLKSRKLAFKPLFLLARSHRR